MVAKKVIAQNIEAQLHETEHQLKSEIAQYQHTLEAAKAAQQTAQLSQQQGQAVNAAFAAAQGTAHHAAQAAAKAAAAAAAQHAMVQEAKQRVAFIDHKLVTALGELQETEASAQKAAASAHIAQSNAVEAAQVVANSASQSQLLESHEHGESYHR